MESRILILLALALCITLTSDAVGVGRLRKFSNRYTQRNSCEFSQLPDGKVTRTRKVSSRFTYRFRINRVPARDSVNTSTVRPDGTVVQKSVLSDGTIVLTATSKNGTVITDMSDPAGTTTNTVFNDDGSKTITIINFKGQKTLILESKDGSRNITTTNARGERVVIMDSRVTFIVTTTTWSDDGSVNVATKFPSGLLMKTLTRKDGSKWESRLINGETVNSVVTLQNGDMEITNVDISGDKVLTFYYNVTSDVRYKRTIKRTDGTYSVHMIYVNGSQKREMLTITKTTIVIVISAEGDVEITTTLPDGTTYVKRRSRARVVRRRRRVLRGGVSVTDIVQQNSSNITMTEYPAGQVEVSIPNPDKTTDMLTYDATTKRCVHNETDGSSVVIENIIDGSTSVSMGSTKVLTDTTKTVSVIFTKSYGSEVSTKLTTDSRRVTEKRANGDVIVTETFMDGNVTKTSTINGYEKVEKSTSATPIRVFSVDSEGTEKNTFTTTEFTVVVTSFMNGTIYYDYTAATGERAQTVTRTDLTTYYNVKANGNSATVETDFGAGNSMSFKMTSKAGTVREMLLSADGSITTSTTNPDKTKIVVTTDESGTQTTTETLGDGTVKRSVDKDDGTEVEFFSNPDKSQNKTIIYPSGEKVTTNINSDGSIKIATVSEDGSIKIEKTSASGELRQENLLKDGSKVVDIKQPDGSNITITTTPNNTITTNVKYVDGSKESTVEETSGKKTVTQTSSGGVTVITITWSDGSSEVRRKDVRNNDVITNVDTEGTVVENSILEDGSLQTVTTKLTGYQKVEIFKKTRQRTVTERFSDGRRIITTTEANGSVTIKTTTSQGSVKEEFTNAGGDSVVVLTEPNGKKVTTTRTTSGKVTVKTLNSDGSTEETITDTDGSVTVTITDKDGNSVKTIDTSDGKKVVQKNNVTGEAIITESDPSGRNLETHIFANKTKIVTQTEKNGNQMVTTFDANGKAVKTVTTTENGSTHKLADGTSTSVYKEKNGDIITEITGNDGSVTKIIQRKDGTTEVSRPVSKNSFDLSRYKQLVFSSKDFHSLVSFISKDVNGTYSVGISIDNVSAVAFEDSDSSVRKCLCQ